MTTEAAPHAPTFDETYIPEKTEFEKLLERDFKPVTETERFLLHRDMYWWQAERFHASGMYRKKFPTVELLFAAMMYGLRFGWHPITSLDNLYPVNEKMTPSVQSMLGVAQLSKGGVSLNLDESNTECKMRMVRGSTGETYSVTWTMEDAKKAGLAGKDNWQKYPRAMLRWRCIGDGLRVLFADRLSGVVSTEEAMDAPPEPANARLAAILPAIADAPPTAMPPTPPAKEAAPTENPAKKSSARPKAQPAERPAPTPEPPAPEPEPLPPEPEPAAPEPEAPGEVSKFLCYKVMPPEDVAPVDWLGFADAPSLAEFYRKMDVGLRTTHWSYLTNDARAMIAAACKPKTAAKPEPKPMVPESPATVIPAHAAAEGSQVDEYQEFVDSKSSSQLKVWFTRVTPDLLATGREAAGVTNLSECNESQLRKAAYAMRKAQGKK